MSDSDEEYAYSEEEEEDELRWYDNQGAALAAKPSANYGGHKPKVAKTEFMKMNKKVPPYFDGRKSWFTFEDELDDWVELTEEPAEKQAISQTHPQTVGGETQRSPPCPQLSPPGCQCQGARTGNRDMLVSL